MGKDGNITTNMTIIPFSVKYQDIAVATTRLVQEQQITINQLNDTIIQLNSILDKICKNNPDLCK